MKQVLSHSNSSSRIIKVQKVQNDPKKAEQKSLWDNLIDKTSADGHYKLNQKIHNINPQQQSLAGESQTDFKNIQRNKVGQPYVPSHFEGGTCIVQVNDEGGLWNRKPLKKHNTFLKESFIFNQTNYEITNKDQMALKDKLIPNYQKEFKTDYGKYYDQSKDHNTTQYTKDSQNKFYDQKVQKRKPLPKPKEVANFLEYKRTNDCLLFN